MNDDRIRPALFLGFLLLGMVVSGLMDAYRLARGE